MSLSNENRIYLSLNAGKLNQRISETEVRTYDKLSRVHLVNITHRLIKENKDDPQSAIKGVILQLHFINANDYFIVETWNNSTYARNFYMVMENIDFVNEIALKTRTEMYNGKEYGKLSFIQAGEFVKWQYTKADMKDCPLPIEDIVTDATAPGGTKVVKNYDLQIEFFKNKIAQVILPKLQMKVNPYPNHPIFEGIVKRNEIAGNHFPAGSKINMPNAASQAEREHNMPAHAIVEPLDDLPF